jgi:hypothetical protein
MSLRLIHGLSARRTFVVAAAMAVVMAAIGYFGQPRIDEARAATPLFVEPTTLDARPIGPRFDVAVASWVAKARAHVDRHVARHADATTRYVFTALTAPRPKARLAHAGFTYGPAMGELELGTVFIGRSMRTALRPAPLPPVAGPPSAEPTASEQP